MKLARILCFPAVVLFLALAASPAAAQSEPCGDPLEATLLAGQHIPAGTLTIWNDETTLYVRYSAFPGFSLAETHLAAAQDLSGIPQTKKGNPIPGRFPFKATHSGAADFIYAQELQWPTESEIVVAAHAVVELAGGGRETAWADGQDFPGANWATYVTYEVQACGPIFE
jgi:hypothetical protein